MSDNGTNITVSLGDKVFDGVGVAQNDTDPDYDESSTMWDGKGAVPLSYLITDPDGDGNKVSYGEFIGRNSSVV